jgi:hypothetical protein
VTIEGDTKQVLSPLFAPSTNATGKTLSRFLLHCELHGVEIVGIAGCVSAININE